MLEAQQAIILQPNSNATLEVATHDAKPMGQNSYSDQDDEDVGPSPGDTVESRPSARES